MAENGRKIVIYQVLPRLFGNTVTEWVPWGTIEQNGVGKFSDFSDLALRKIRELGVTHLWLTGVLHHALIGDYKLFGISDDDPDVVKGRAGSPYAIKDYYGVNPDLADDPAHRNEEFFGLIDRVHRHGMKVIIDIVPNHTARKYESILKPREVEDLGATDDSSVEYARNNNFYYIPGSHFEVPDQPGGYLPLGGAFHPLADGKFDEFPAKWTGNGTRQPKPGTTDWYETVKLNYGVRPDGTFDFNPLPQFFRTETLERLLTYWNDQDVPDTWNKIKDIALFWLQAGVDGFRFDMAEMVPIPFWNFLNTHIKNYRPDALAIAEIYRPDQYMDFIELGKMDFLYDKVDLYDTLKDIITEKSDCHAIFPAFDKHYGISGHLLHFMENHDELRIASDAFAGNPEKAKPAMVLSACMGKGAVMLYNGQEVGEPARENAGFGSPDRTSIYDYIGIPKHQQWMNMGLWDGAQLNERDRQLRAYYRQLMHFTLDCPALNGPYYDLHRYNSSMMHGYPGNKIYSFARWSSNDHLIFVCNFSERQSFSFRFMVYYELIEIWALKPGTYRLTDYFKGTQFHLHVAEDQAYMDVSITPLESLILSLEETKS